MTLPRAIVFDMDGTLTDSEIVWEQVRRDLAAAEGVPYPEHATTDMMGMSTPEWSSYCAQLGFAGTPAEIAARIIEGVADAYRDGRVQMMPGAKAAVQRAAELAPLAVASSSPPVLIQAGTQALGVAELLAITVSSEEVEAGKPHPAVYLEACRRLGVDPADAVAVEDSSNGIVSAVAAGMKVVAVPPPVLGPSAEALAQADAVIDSLDALTHQLLSGLFVR